MSPLDTAVGEKAALVKPDLSDRRLNLETCIPGPTLWAVEAATEWAGVSEGGVDDVGLRHPQEQFARTNRSVTAFLRNLPLVSRGIEFAQVGKNIGGKWKAFKDTLSTVLGRDQPVSSRLFELYKLRQSVPAPLRID